MTEKSAGSVARGPPRVSRSSVVRGSALQLRSPPQKFRNWTFALAPTSVPVRSPAKFIEAPPNAVTLHRWRGPPGALS